MALVRQFAVRARCTSASSSCSSLRAPLPIVSARHRLLGLETSTCNGLRRGFSSVMDPYRTLGVERNASDSDVKKAYRDKALKWHPDKNPENRDEAHKQFSDATSAYDILKNPDTRREFDLTGRLGGGAGGPGGAHGGFHPGNVSQADAERMFREAFGFQGGMDMQQILQQLFEQQQRQGGGSGGPPRQRMLQVGMEVQIRSDVDTIHHACRACGIDAENDERRERCAGKIGTITAADPRDQSVKVRVMVMQGRADEVWFGAGAVAFLPEEQGPSVDPGLNPYAGGGLGGGPPRPRSLQVGMEVQIRSDVATIHTASRACGIDAENDERRARCSGKIGTVIDADPQDQSVKVRVMVLPGRADEVWFGGGAVDFVPDAEIPKVDPGPGPFAGGSGGRPGGCAGSGRIREERF